VTALWLASGQIPATTLSVLINEHQVKDGTALDFFLETMVTLKTEKGGQMVVNVVKKSGTVSTSFQDWSNCWVIKWSKIKMTATFYLPVITKSC
jgi:hypothetical protein